MLSTSSPFIDSSISIYHNAIKALIFGAAQFLLAFCVFKSFSLFASRGNLFSSYLMFMEDPVQKLYYVASRGFSRGTFLVLGFTIVYTAASLYGTLLWGLDAPGYIMRSQTVTASKLNKSLLERPGYINYLDIWPNKMATLEKELPTIIGANLYKPGVNFSLTTNVDRGRAEHITPINPGVGGMVGPLKPCDTTFMNIAYGGIVDDTDCTTANPGQPPQFFGTVDTAAVLIVYGLGDGRSNLSSVAVDENALQWASNHSDTMDDLLVARGFIASVDPSLVTLNISILRPAISYLQMFLVLLSVIFAAISYSSLRLLSSSHWSNSLLANVLGPAEHPNSLQDPGYVKKFPDIRLKRVGDASVITVNGLMFRLNRLDTDPTFFNKRDKRPISTQVNEVVAEGQSFLIHNH